MSTSTAESRNGIRQPHASKSSSLWTAASTNSSAVREQVAQRHAGLRPRDQKPRRAGVAVLGDDQHRAAPLAADARSPGPARQTSSRIGRRDADRGVRRQQADREGREPIISRRDDEHLLAADPVTEVAEDHAAERPRHEPEGVGAERQQRAGRPGRVGEEQRAEDEGGRRPVEEEVVPLDGGADQAGEDDLDDVRSGPAGGSSSPGRRVTCVVDMALCRLLVMRRSSRRPW